MLKASAHFRGTPECWQLAQLRWEATHHCHLANTMLCGAHAVDISSSACLQGEGKVLRLLLETHDPCRAEAGVGESSLCGRVYGVSVAHRQDHPGQALPGTVLGKFWQGSVATITDPGLL